MDAPQAEHVRFLFDPRSTLTALARQRRRFRSGVAALTVDEMASPSRCEGWTVADVLRHLVWADTTMRQLWSGDESPAASFDPRTTPDEWVRANRVVPDDEVRDRYLSSTENMIEELESAGPERFGFPSISPVGRVPWWMSAVHLGWDSTVHERDVLGPLGRAVEVAPDETVPCLAYSVVLASFFSGRHPLDVRIGPVRVWREDGTVTARVASVNPDEDEAADVPPRVVTMLSTSPLPTIDALCGRGSLTSAVSGDEAVVERLGGLARYFTSTE